MFENAQRINVTFVVLPETQVGCGRRSTAHRAAGRPVRAGEGAPPSVAEPRGEGGREGWERKGRPPGAQRHARVCRYANLNLKHRVRTHALTRAHTHVRTHTPLFARMKRLKGTQTPQPQVRKQTH